MATCIYLVCCIQFREDKERDAVEQLLGYAMRANLKYLQRQKRP